jgi:hypothetical protein
LFEAPSIFFSSSPPLSVAIYDKFYENQFPPNDLRCGSSRFFLLPPYFFLSLRYPRICYQVERGAKQFLTLILLRSDLKNLQATIPLVLKCFDSSIILIATLPCRFGTVIGHSQTDMDFFNNSHTSLPNNTRRFTMRQSTSSIVLVAILLMAVALSTVQAQVTTTVTASGTVLTPISVSGSNLDFGNSIFPGINKSVGRTAGGAAAFTISGEASKELTATFTLPSTLTNGGSSLTISFSSTDAGHSTSSGGQATATAFNPASGLTTTLSGGGNLYLWLGGSVAPTYTQTAGVYSGDVTISLVYTGN